MHFATSSSPLQDTTMMLYAEFDPVVEFPVIGKAPPPPLDASEDELKEWAYQNYKEQIKAAMHIKSHKERSELALAQSRQRLERLNLLDVIARVQEQYLQSEGPKVVFGCLLEGLLKLTESEYGFIGEVKHENDGTMYLQTHAISNIAWDAATRAFYDDNVDSGLKFFNMDSLFGKVMTTKEFVISNNPASDPRACGVPKGHPPLNHFLGIPFFKKKGGEMNGMVGIANKAGGYSQADIDFLQPFTVTCSNLIQAYFQIQQNVILINTLEEKVAERTQELELANRSLEEANRKVTRASAAQLEHFACMSHEIRTPLNCIIGLSSLLQETALNPQQEESVRMIVTSGDLLLTIVNDVLDYSKLESGNVDIVIKQSNLQDTLNAIVHSIENKGQEKGVALHTFYDASLPEFVQTDGRRLQQILYNLLGNALKFSKEDGVMELEVTICDAPKRLERTGSSSGESICNAPENTTAPSCPRDHMETVEVTDTSESEGPTSSRCPFHRSSPRSTAAATSDGEELKPPGKVLRFVVKDYGHGINKKDFDTIFMPFHQASSDTERIYGGTGLGLSITSKLVNGLGGSISVDSKEGEWSKFVVEFPFTDVPADVDAISRSMQDATVLLVLDDQKTGMRPHSVARFEEICNRYNVKRIVFKNMDEMDKHVKNGAVLQGRYICLCDEELYKPEPYRNLAAKAKSLLLTFGSKYSVKEKNGHYRCFTQMIPSVLMKSMNSLFDASASPPLVDTIVPPSSPIPYGDLRVLVAEDNLINQKIIVRMLKRLGVVEVDVVDNGQKAVEREATKPYDIVFMDMQMPVMDGIDACRLIVGRQGGHPIPKVVFVTAQVANNFEAEATEAGSSGFLPKPFNLRDVEMCFEKLHSIGESPIDAYSWSTTMTPKKRLRPSEEIS